MECCLAVQTWGLENGVPYTLRYEVLTYCNTVTMAAPQPAGRPSGRVRDPWTRTHPGKKRDGGGSTPIFAGGA